MFPPTACRGPGPARRRSSGTKPTPARSASAGPRGADGRPASRTCRCGAGRARAVQRLQQLGAARRHEPGEADDLAGAHGRDDAGGFARPGRAPRGSTQILDLSTSPAPAAAAERREQGSAPGGRPSSEIRCRSAGPGAAPATLRRRAARSPGRRCVDLLEAVGDVDDRHAAPRAARGSANSRSTSASASAAVGSSMIRTRASRESALAISTSCCSPTRSEPTGRRRVDLHAERGRASRGRCGPSPAGRRCAAGPRLAAEGEVLRHGERRDQVQLLVDRGDAGAWASAGPAKRTGSPVEDDLAVVVGDDAGEDLDQRATSRRRSRRAGRAPHPPAGSRSTPRRARTPPKRLVIPDIATVTWSLMRADPGPSGEIAAAWPTAPR